MNRYIPYIVGLPLAGIVAAVFLSRAFLSDAAKPADADSAAAISTGAQAGAGAGAVTVSTALPPAIPSKKRVVKIGLNSWVAIANEKGWLRETFDPLNVGVEIVDRRVAGSAEAALFQRGDIHIAERMAYPSLQHKANGFDFVVVWASGDCNPRRATTIVRKESPVRTLADLKGKVLGAQRLGCPYFATYEALLAEGIQLDTELKKGDVRYVNITGNPSIVALLTGEIEALSVHAATAEFGHLYEEGRVREIATARPGGQYVTGGGRALIITLRRFADRNPDIVQAYLRLYDRTRRWIVDGNNYEETAEAAARAFRVSKSVSLYIIKDESTLVLDPGRPDAQETIDALSRFLKWAIVNGDDFYGTKPLTDAQIAEFVDRRFFAGGDYFVDTTGKPLSPFSSSPPPSFPSESDSKSESTGHDKAGSATTGTGTVVSNTKTATKATGPALPL
ncbi:MAG: ABC transporter substrate-binding protein [Opitutaceae bacterium]|jgi:sulfonate transport system substrate-binding protein|nr:ABC transporter substrate-binding protein [Opitutaceae bacterium]